jgi:uncharacterized protein YbbK (DUF523 family)
MDRILTDTLGQYIEIEYVPVCPEVECGLGVPRESMHLRGDSANPRLVTTGTEIDHTDLMVNWAGKKVEELESEALSGFIFKSRSPSCGMERVEVNQGNSQHVKPGVGIFARIFVEHFPRIPVEDESRLSDTGIRENFIEAIFTNRRLRIEG